MNKGSWKRSFGSLDAATSSGALSERALVLAYLTAELDSTRLTAAVYDEQCGEKDTARDQAAILERVIEAIGDEEHVRRVVSGERALAARPVTERKSRRR